MLRAAHRQLNRSGLVFPNPPLAEAKFALRLHAAQLPQLDWVSNATFNLSSSSP